MQWHVQVRRKGYPVQTKTFTNRGDAEKWVSIIESEMHRGIFISRTAAEQTTLKELIDRYRIEITPHHRGHESESVRLTALAKHKFASRFIATLQPSDFAAYRDKRLETVKPGTVVREMGIFQQVIEQARREWGINLHDNPVRLVKRPKVQDARERRFEEDEEARLMAALDDCRTIYMKPLIEFATETAMRQGELLALSWDNIDLSIPSALLPETKNGSSRTVPLSKRAVQILKQLPRQISGQVFPLSKDAVKKAWARATKRAGIVDLHFHDLRHEATSRLAEKVTNVLMLASITGHKDLKMLKRYYHPKVEDLAKLLG